MEQQRDFGIENRGARDVEDEKELALHEERPHLEKAVRERIVRVRKRVTEDQASQTIPRDIEEAQLEHAPVGPEDSGEVETLPDGSLSIPLMEEELVVTKRLVVRERVIVRKHMHTEQTRVDSTLKREHAEVEVEEPSEKG